MNPPAIDSFPSEFLDRLADILPTDQADAILQTFQYEKELSFRCNTLKGSTETLFEKLCKHPASTPLSVAPQPVDWYPPAFTFPHRLRHEITHHPMISSGEIYIHNLSSMATVWALDPKPQESALDLAAAPGGKTLQIAAQMNGEGNLSAVEVVKNRFFRLKQNLKTAGAEYVKTFCSDGRQVGVKTGPRFDRVLLDAPCSGEARFRTDQKETYQFWGKKKISDCKRKQQGLIKSAFRALKPGGIMIYSTCSFAPEENESVVNYLLKKFNDAEILPLELPFPNWQAGLTQWQGKAFREEVAESRRILPTDQYNGLFLCKIKKCESVG